MSPSPNASGNGAATGCRTREYPPRRCIPPLPSPTLLASLAPVSPLEPGSAVRVHRAPDVFALWEAWEREAGAPQDVPYWAVPWPAAIALARLCLSAALGLPGKRVLDLGCGGGAAGIAAALAGAAAAIANDIDPVALHVAGLNATANGVVLQAQSSDLLRAAGVPPAEVILVGDLFYERSRSERLLHVLRQWSDAGAVVIIADAGRPFAPREGVCELDAFEIPVNPDLEGVSRRRVRLLGLQGRACRSAQCALS